MFLVGCVHVWRERGNVSNCHSFFFLYIYKITKKQAFSLFFILLLLIRPSFSLLLTGSKLIPSNGADTSLPGSNTKSVPWNATTSCMASGWETGCTRVGAPRRNTGPYKEAKEEGGGGR